jgi:periplasmic protein TonB
VKRRQWIVSVPLSVALHILALLGLAWAISRAAELPLLFVDLATLDLGGAISSLHRGDDQPPESRRPGGRVAASRTGSDSRAGNAAPTTHTAPAPARPSVQSGAADPVTRPMAPAKVDPAPTAVPVITREERRDVSEPSAQTSPSRIPEQPEGVETSGDSNLRTTAPAQEPGALPSAAPSSATGHEAGTKEAAGRGSLGSGAASAAGSGAGAGSGGGRSGRGEGGAALAMRGAGPAEGGSEYGRYLSQWRRRIHENVRYPLAARRRGLTGTVQLDIVIQPSGAVASVRVAESSSHGVLDEAAMEAVRALPPLPFPSDLTPRSLRARLPVVFDLQ